MADKILLAKQMNRFMQMQVQAAELDDDKAMEVADLYPEWQYPKAYVVGEMFKYGVNSDGETQLYRVVQAHTSEAQNTPDIVPALYKAVGFTDTGTPIWTQPLGAHDAYSTGDVVSHKDQLWISTVDGNVWEPGVYGWEVYEQ